MPFFFFFNDTATTEIYTLSLHDALPISALYRPLPPRSIPRSLHISSTLRLVSASDRKSTRLNSSHLVISYAVFCLKKKRSKRQFGRRHQTSNSAHCTSLCSSLRHLRART